MSWFMEIAEKAEDLLNKVDKTAATALQNKIKFGSSNDIRVKSNFPNKSYEGSFSDQSSRNRNFASPATNITNTRISKSVSNMNPAPRKDSGSDDEKLLQFLNSSEPISGIQTKLLLLETNSTEMPTFPESTAVTVEENGTSTEMKQPVEQKDVMELDHLIEDQHLEKSAASLVLLSSEPSDEQSNVISDVSSSWVEISPVKDDVSLLKGELLAASKKADHAESEMKRMQKKLEHWNSLISGNDKLVRELQERERDFSAVLDAKDSQLAVLKVRLEEADQELQNKRTLLEELKSENEKLTKHYMKESETQNNTIDALRKRIVEVETELNQSREAYRSTQNEHMLRMSKFEEEQRRLAENVTNYQRKWTELNDRNKELMNQIQNSHRNLENLQREYSDYKVKAQRILQSKETLILSLKEGNFDNDRDGNNESSCAVLKAEADGIKEERDLLREELRRANESVESLRNEIQDIEKLSQNDSDTAREHFRNLEEQLRQERLFTEEVQLLNGQLKEEMQFLREESQRAKSNFQSRIQDREAEIEKLRKQLTTKSMSTVSQDELESRLHALTENLIQKQTTVEALSTEKNSLVLQLERLEQQLKEAQHYEAQSHTVAGLSTSVNDRKQKAVVFLDSPFDSNITRKVKRMYSGVDAFSIRLGVFFRRYPIARVFLILYMLLLHLWVMIVLLTYEPEIHSSSHNIVNTEAV